MWRMRDTALLQHTWLPVTSGEAMRVGSSAGGRGMWAGKAVENNVRARRRRVAVCLRGNIYRLLVIMTPRAPMPVGRHTRSARRARIIVSDST